MSEERDLQVDQVLRDVSNKLGALGADIASIKTDVSEIKVQTIKTNGRVNGLEQWMFYIKGAIAIVVLVVGWILLYKSGH